MLYLQKYLYNSTACLAMTEIKVISISFNDSKQFGDILRVTLESTQ